MDILEWVKKQTGKIADNVKDYKFYVKHQPAFIDTKTTIHLTPFTNRDEVATVPCLYRWFKIKNGLITEVPEFRGNSFVCDPCDVGCLIQAEITSTDPEHPGTAILKFGPVKFDVMIKKQIEHSLSTKSAIFNVDLVQRDEIKQCEIKVTEQMIRINHSYSKVEYCFDYNLNEPRVETSVKTPNRVNINFSEKYESQVKGFIYKLFGFQEMTSSMRTSNQQRIEIQFPNKTSKDKFLYSLKAFNTRKLFKNAAVLQKIENIDFNQDANFNTMLEIESLKADIIKLNRLNEKYQMDKRRYYDEARKLEAEIQEIIVTYTKIAEGKCQNQEELDQSVMELREKKDEVMERKLHALMNQNEALRDRIDFLSAELSGKNVYPPVPESSEQPMQQSRGGFIKKKQFQEVKAENPFNNILQSLNQSQIKQSSKFEQQVKNLTEEKVFLAKKLNQSVQKINKLQKKLQMEQQNQTSINFNENNSISVEKRHNASAFDLGEDRNKIYLEFEELKKQNTLLQKENYKLKSDIPMVSSKEEEYRVVVMSPQNRGQQNSFNSAIDKLTELDKIESQPNPQACFGDQALRKRIKELEDDNEKLRDQIDMLLIQKQVLIKEKTALESKYKKKMSELMNENSMYRRNQDALNRSQNLSMEMDLYNEEQVGLLKEQNQLLSNENERLSKICDKYVNEAKQVSKLKEQIKQLQASNRQHQENRKNTDLSYSKSREEILLDNL